VTGSDGIASVDAFMKNQIETTMKNDSKPKGINLLGIPQKAATGLLTTTPSVDYCIRTKRSSGKVQICLKKEIRS